MKAQLLSDLHTEFYYGDAMDMLKTLVFTPKLDFLLLPGDIVVPAHQPKVEMRGIFEFLASKARHTLLTFGNHEFYGAKYGHEVESRILEVLPINCHLLDNSATTIDGVEFYGGTMWFPDDPLNQLYERQLNDFNLIGDIHKWVYQKNAEFRENGRKLIRSETVVLSHHLPSPKSTHPMFAGSDINRFFVSDETDLILDKKPRLWVHGHTHLTCDYTLGETRVVCSPYGYPQERKWTRYISAEFEI
jgi:Icc-related predicted phosphoesterase